MDRDCILFSAVKREADDRNSDESSAHKTGVVGPHITDLSSAVPTDIDCTDWKPVISGVCSLADKHFKTSEICRTELMHAKSDINPAVDLDEFWRLQNGRRDQWDVQSDTKWEINATLPVCEDTESGSFLTSTTGTDSNCRAEEFRKCGEKASVENEKEKNCNEPEQRHSKLNAAGQSRKHSCQYCGKRFSVASSAKRHEILHSGVKPHACTYCEKRFSFKYQLNVHLQRHAGLKQFSCVECDKQFNTKDDLTKHMTMHSGVRRYACLHCDKRFVRSRSLCEHIRRYSEEKQFVCDQCDKQFATRHNLTRHTKRKHSGIKQRSAHCSTSKYQCDVKAEYKRETFAIGRISDVRETSERFQVGDVGTGSWLDVGSGRLSAEDEKDDNKVAVGLRNERNSSTLDHVHSKLNADGQSKKHPCQYCGKMFSQACHARRHEMIHTGVKPYMCSYCEKRFSAKCHLQIHTRRHTGEKPFACIHCDKTFAASDDLKSHAPVHDRERQYACSHCPKRFRYRSNLRVHEQRHSGQKPYSCTHCVKRFATSDDLRNHTKTHYRGMLKEHPHSVCSGSETLYRSEGHLFEAQKHSVGDDEVTHGSVEEGFEKQVQKKWTTNSTSEPEQHLVAQRNSEQDSIRRSGNIYGSSGFPVATMGQLLQCVSESSSRCSSDADSIASKSSADWKPHWGDGQQLGDPDVGEYPDSLYKNDEQNVLPELPSISIANSTRRQYASGCYDCGANGCIVDKSFAKMDHAAADEEFANFCCKSINNDWETGNYWKSDVRDSVLKRYVCENCPSRYSVSSQLQQHSLTHDVETAYECEECRTKFTDYGHLLWHMYAHAQEIGTSQHPWKQEPVDFLE